MAKKKFDKSKYQPTIDDITTLGEALAEYAKECAEAKQLMLDKGVASLLVSNWDTVQKSLSHLDNMIRQMVPAAKFGKLDPRIHSLLEGPTVQDSIAHVAGLIVQPTEPGQKPRLKKGGSKP